MTFENLGLSADLLATVAREGYTEPTPVQSAAIPLILAGRDVLAAAQTGTGKTAAFVLPILEMLRQHANAGFSPARHPVRVLILTPTRELAVQISESVKTYGRGVPLRIHRRLRRHAHRSGDQDPLERRRDPGRHARPPAGPHRASAASTSSQVEILVLDEADRMLDMGFIPDVRKIVGAHPGQAPDAALLGHLLRRDPAPGRRVPDQPRDGRSRRPQQHRRQPDPGPLPGRPGAQGRPAAST